MSAATSTMGSWVRSTKKESRKLKGNLFYNYRKSMFFTIRIVDDRSKATEQCVVSFQYATIPDSQESSSWLSASQAALSAQVERGEMPVEDARSWQCFSTDLGFSKTVFDSNENNADFRGAVCAKQSWQLDGHSYRMILGRESLRNLYVKCRKRCFGWDVGHLRHSSPSSFLQLPKRQR